MASPIPIPSTWDRDWSSLKRGEALGERGGEADEIFWFCLPQVLEMIDGGEIEDAKTIIALLVLWARSDNVLSRRRREEV